MKLYQDSGEIFIPDGQPVEIALARTTHMGIGAHQDDLEIMAMSGILDCFQREDNGFCGVIVTTGSGSPRQDVYQDYTDEEMCMVRRKEQKKAAVVGEYTALALLLLGPLISLNNLYNNSRYAKDDVRGLISYIEEHASSSDIVLYNNAILLALHEHYQERETYADGVGPFKRTVPLVDVTP